MTDQERPAWAARLQSEREARGWNKAELGRRLLKTSGSYITLNAMTKQIRRHEAGDFFPRDWASTYAAVFDIEQRDLFPAPVSSSAGTVEEKTNEEEMERRRLLQALAVLGAASAPGIEALRNIRDSVDRALGRDQDSHLDEWEETVAEYGYSYVLLPPRQMFSDLVVDLVAVQQIMSRRNSSDPSFPSWCRVSSGLSLLLAKVLCNLGQSHQARPWWTTARQAADTAGDNDLGLWISAEQLVHGLYDRRPTPILLRRANEIAQRAPDTPGRGLAQIRTIRAQLLALDGQAAAAKEELRRSGEVFERLPDPVTSEVRSISGWALDRLLYTEAWVHAHLGERDQLDKLDRAAGGARDVVPLTDHRVRAQLSLLQAFGHVRAGDVTEGVRRAKAVYETHPAEHRTTMVTSLADQVLEAVPTRSSSDPAVVGYRELLSSTAQRKAIT